MSDRRVRAEAAGLLLSFVAIPIGIYLVSYTGWFVEHGPDLGKFFALQRQIAHYHGTLKVTHAYQSQAAGWPLILRPVAYYYKAPDAGGSVHHILAMGNPGLWWPFLAALPLLLAMAVRRSGWDARFTAAFLLSQYVPWLLVHRPLFLYYMTPVVPFMALGMAQAVESLPRGLRAGTAVTVCVAVALGALIWMPVWIGYGVSRSHWGHLMLFRSWI